MPKIKSDDKVPEAAAAVADACKNLAGTVTAISRFRRNTNLIKNLGALLPDAAKGITVSMEAFNAAMVDAMKGSKTDK
jgi:hypothetical protein